jgi:D-alanyl-lipoteichoic acid acyltransferase DltB (MBOAT superfamily)
LILGTVCFAFQVYCDFSGYTDIAIGAARTMGIRLMDNFRQPYLATSIADFWKRWHISLSSWLTDYVYSAFTRARWLNLKWYPKLLTSLLLTFLVSGVWHGAAWTYIVWGALHGTYLMASVTTQNYRRLAVERLGLDRLPRVHTALRVALTFSLVCLSYVFFRAESLGDAVYIVTHFFASPEQPTMSGPGLSFIAAAMVLIGIVMAGDFWNLNGSFEAWIVGRPTWMRWTAYYAVTASIFLLGVPESGQFIYFQF